MSDRNTSFLILLCGKHGSPETASAGMEEAHLSNIPLSPLCFFGKVVPIQTSLLRIWLSLFDCSPFHLIHLRMCEEPRAEPGVGPAMGHLP